MNIYSISIPRSTVFIINITCTIEKKSMPILYLSIQEIYYYCELITLHYITITAACGCRPCGLVPFWSFLPFNLGTTMVWTYYGHKNPGTTSGSIYHGHGTKLMVLWYLGNTMVQYYGNTVLQVWYLGNEMKRRLI